MTGSVTAGQQRLYLPKVKRDNEDLASEHVRLRGRGRGWQPVGCTANGQGGAHKARVGERCGACLVRFEVQWLDGSMA
eukprot:1022774-Prymnesium_polylepis.2